MEIPFSVRCRYWQPKHCSHLPSHPLLPGRMGICFSISCHYWMSRKVLDGFIAAGLAAFTSNHSIVASLNQTRTVKTFQNIWRKSLAQKRFLKMEVPNIRQCYDKLSVNSMSLLISVGKAAASLTHCTASAAGRALMNFKLDRNAHCIWSILDSWFSQLLNLQLIVLMLRGSFSPCDGIDTSFGPS